MRGKLASFDALLDLGLALVLTPVLVLAAHNIEPEPGDRPTDAVALVLVGIAASTLAVRRRWPLAMLAIVTAALAVYAGRDHPGGPVYVLAPIALYSVVRMHPRRLALGAAAISTATVIGAGWLGHDGPEVVQLLSIGWAGVAILAAEVMTARDERRAIAEARHVEAAERQAESMQRQLAEERLRIARDLHDSVAHTMATINVQSGVAAHVIDRRPAEARQALEAVRSASGEVLDELAAMLTLLRADREPGANGGDGAVPRNPMPDLGALDALVERSRLAGLDVEVVAGDVAIGSIPATISTSAYRIVQEALTNVVRHAGTDRATVAILRDPTGALCVEVTDDGDGSHQAATSAGGGMGLIGIRERAEATGGSVEIGPRRAGGFRVQVVWPA